MSKKINSNSNSIWNIDHPVNIKDRIVDKLMSQIIDGELKVGDKLPVESFLCSEMGVSRVTLREAIKQLEALGFVKIDRGNGTIVQMPDFGIIETVIEFFGKTGGISLKDFHDFRSLIEIEVVGLATEKGDKALIKSLDRLLKEAESNIEDEFSYVELDFRFHKEILEASPNKLYSMMIAPFDAYLRKSRTLSFSDISAAKKTIKMHKEIVDAMHDKDAMKAREQMSKHLQKTAEDLNLK